MENKAILSNVQVLAVVGKGRSGTSLLQFMLDSHPEISAPPEALFIIHLWKKYSKVKWNADTCRQFSLDLLTERGFRDHWTINTTSVYEALLTYEVRSFQEAVLVTYLLTSSSSDASIKWIVLKGPRFTLFLDILLKIFPSIKFIHLVRDPRDNTLSHRKHLYNRSTSAIAHKWILNNSLVDERVKNHNGMLLRYEDLVQSSLISTQNICEFLNISWHKNMLHPNKASQELHQKNPFFFRPLHQNLLEDISSKSVNKWKNELTKKELTIIESIVFPYAKKFDYHLSGPADPAHPIKSPNAKTYAIYYFMRGIYILPFSLRSTLFRIAKRISELRSSSSTTKLL